MFKDYTMIGLLDELDVIECFQQPGKALFVGEILNRQKQLYEDLGVQPPMNPASLCQAGNVGNMSIMQRFLLLSHFIVHGEK